MQEALFKAISVHRSNSDVFAGIRNQRFANWSIAAPLFCCGSDAAIASHEHSGQPRGHHHARHHGKSHAQTRTKQCTRRPTKKRRLCPAKMTKLSKVADDQEDITTSRDSKTEGAQAILAAHAMACEEDLNNLSSCPVCTQTQTNWTDDWWTDTEAISASDDASRAVTYPGHPHLLHYVGGAPVHLYHCHCQMPCPADSQTSTTQAYATGWHTEMAPRHHMPYGACLRTGTSASAALLWRDDGSSIVSANFNHCQKYAIAGRSRRQGILVGQERHLQASVYLTLWSLAEGFAY